jgi:hypothetical protein
MAGDLQYLAPVFSVAQPKMKPVIAIAFAMVMCLLNVNTRTPCSQDLHDYQLTKYAH